MATMVMPLMITTVAASGQDQDRRLEEAEQVEASRRPTRRTPEKQTLEGLNRDVDGAPVFRLGQEDTGDEGAERHRQAADGGDQSWSPSRRAGRPP